MMRVIGWSAAAIATLVVAGAVAWIWYVNNVETPKYAVLQSDGAIELRSYPALTVAEVTRSGERARAVNSGFRPLAGYIFAREREGEAIAMTAPVTQTPVADETFQRNAANGSSTATSGREWSVRFIMPEGYDVASLPKPATGDVRLLELPAAKRIAIRFSGVATDELIETHAGELLAWAAAQGLKIDPVPTIAYYNDPFTPGFLRRNEVLFDVLS